MSLEVQTDHVKFEDYDSKGVITLNRPKVLNSLDQEMVEAMQTVLDEWEKGDKKLVIVKGMLQLPCCN